MDGGITHWSAEWNAWWSHHYLFINPAEAEHWTFRRRFLWFGVWQVVEHERWQLDTVDRQLLIADCQAQEIVARLALVPAL